MLQSARLTPAAVGGQLPTFKAWSLNAVNHLVAGHLARLAGLDHPLLNIPLDEPGNRINDSWSYIVDYPRGWCAGDIVNGGLNVCAGDVSHDYCSDSLR